jgi:hypothetical protein
MVGIINFFNAALLYFYKAFFGTNIPFVEVCLFGSQLDGFGRARSGTI